MRIGGFNLGSNQDLPQEVEMWYHFPMVAATIFTLVGVHFFDLITLIIVAAIIDFVLSILKYAIVSSYKIIYYSIGHSIVFWIWSIGTLIYFIIVGPWWLGAYVLAYHIFIGSIIGLPGIIIVDGIARGILGKHPKYYAAERFSSRFEKSELSESLSDLQEDESSGEKIKESEEIEIQSIYCKECGIELPIEAKFCKKCGTKL